MRLTPLQRAGAIDLQVVVVPIADRRTTYVRVVVWSTPTSDASVATILLDVDLCQN